MDKCPKCDGAVGDPEHHHEVGPRNIVCPHCGVKLCAADDWTYDEDVDDEVQFYYWEAA